MVGSISQKTYKEICKNWVSSIIFLSESQVNIWPPLSGGYSLLHQFAKDKALQAELFGNIPRTLSFIDGHETDDFTYEQFEKQFFHSIRVERPEHDTVDGYIGSNTNHLFGLFLMGMDNALMQGNVEVLKHIGSLLEKHSHLTLVFLSELPIPELPIYNELIARHMLLDSIHYQQIFTPEDSVAFLTSPQDLWQFTYPNGVERILAENIGGHVLLLEEAARIVRNNPQIGFKEVLSDISLLRKAGAIYNALFAKDKEVFKAVLFGQKVESNSEYLRETKLINNGKIGIQYFHYMRFNLLSLFNPFEGQETPQLKLSYIEHQVFELLSSTKGVVSREIVAKTIWGEGAETKYSDWAIDQIIHRLREKLRLAQNDLQIQTKKGEGFQLLKNE